MLPAASSTTCTPSFLALTFILYKRGRLHASSVRGQNDSRRFEEGSYVKPGRRVRRMCTSSLVHYYADWLGGSNGYSGFLESIDNRRSPPVSMYSQTLRNTRLTPPANLRGMYRQ
jgi:hypothetical protein